jgi:adenylylsulfate kinase-like enzyme
MLSGLVWITGLPGAGKSTFAEVLKGLLLQENVNVVHLDGDALRDVLDNKNYALEARKSLAYKYSRLCKLLVDQNQLVLCSTVSMFKDVRRWNRENISPYLEVYLDISPEVLRVRDQKSLYSGGADGSLSNVPGINQDIELPENPDFHFNNIEMWQIQSCADQVKDKISELNKIVGGR